MNSIPIELCERNGYVGVVQKLGKSSSTRHLDNFIRFKKHTNREDSKPKSKLSFQVSCCQFLGGIPYHTDLITHDLVTQKKKFFLPCHTVTLSHIYLVTRWKFNTNFLFFLTF